MSAFGEARMEAMQDLVGEAVREKEIEYEDRIEVLEKTIKEKDMEIEKLKEDVRLYAISICPDKDRELNKKEWEIANAKKTIERDEALRTEYHREIAELKEKNAELREWLGLARTKRIKGEDKVE
jgi:hypothetical protein